MRNTGLAILLLQALFWLEFHFWFHLHIFNVVAFIIGAIFLLCRKYGMKIATKTNVRTTQAARTSLKTLKVSFGGGTVMGLGSQV